MNSIVVNCSQYDANSVIEDQRIPCRGKVFAIDVELCDEIGYKVYQATSTVCEAHMPSWTGRGLERQGYHLGEPQETGVIGRNPESSSPFLER